jgi:hypothetical protein
MPATTYLANAWLNAAFRNVAYTSPATVYVALFTAAPTVAGGGTEIAGNSYARVAAPFGAPAGSPATISNTGVITFPTATGAWGTPVAAGIFDALAGGNLLAFAAIPVAQQVPVNGGNAYKYQVGQLVATAS